MERWIQQPENLRWLWLVLVVIVFCWRGESRRRHGLQAFGQALDPGNRSPAHTTRRRLLRAMLDICVLVLLVIALADPRWGHSAQRIPTPQTQIVFLLDASRSMLARDVLPSRFERARSWILDQLATLTGEPVALVAYSGLTTGRVPLTRDYKQIRRELAQLDPNDMPTAGTQLGPALRAASESFVTRLPGEKVLVVVTDGEDHGAGAADVARTLAGELAINLVFVGVGDSDVGSRIPLRSPVNDAASPEYLEYDGAVVWSKLNAALLKEMAEAGGGTLFRLTPATAQANSAGDWLSPQLQLDGFGFRIESLPVPRFQWFLAMAIGLLMADAFLANGVLIRGSRLSQATSSTARHGKQRASAAMLVSAFMAVGTTTTSAEGPRQAFESGEAAVRNEQFDDALEEYRRASELLPGRPEPVFNLGVVLYRRGEWEAARTKFEQVYDASDPGLAAKAHFNAGNCFYAAVLDGDLTKAEAIETLWKAIANYRAALQQRPNWKDPRVNIQLAYLLMQQIDKSHATEEDTREGTSTSKNSASEDSSPNDEPAPESPAPNEPQSSTSGQQSSDSRQEQNAAGGESARKAPPSEPESSEDDRPSSAGQTDQGADAGGPRNGNREGLTAPQSADGRASDASNDAGTNKNPSPAGKPLSQSDAEKMIDEILSRDRGRREQRTDPIPAGGSASDKDW